MKTRYFRNITVNHGGYATVSLPVELFRRWTEDGATHVELLYDEEEDRLIILPM